MAAGAHYAWGTVFLVAKGNGLGRFVFNLSIFSRLVLVRGLQELVLPDSDPGVDFEDQCGDTGVPVHLCMSGLVLVK